MPKPKFEIRIATNSAQSSVICNGQDISSAVQEVNINQKTGELPVVTLKMHLTQGTTAVRLFAETVFRLQTEPEAPAEPAHTTEPAGLQGKS